jgi:uncharacterized protein with HEPN domain
VSDRTAVHLQRMLECAWLATEYARDMTRDAFLVDRKTQQAIVLNLMVIGEVANRLQEDDPAFASLHAGLPWTAMRGMRNRIAHGYFDVDMTTVWETVQRDLPALVGQLASIAPDEGRPC